MMKHQTEAAPTLKEGSLGRDVPQALESIVSKMLAKKVDQRYQHFAQVVRDLGDFKRGEAVSVSVAKALPTASKTGDKIGSGLLLGIAASLLVFSFLALSLGAIVLTFIAHRQLRRIRSPSQSPPSLGS
jgi:hypothetical protein